MGKSSFGKQTGEIRLLATLTAFVMAVLPILCLVGDSANRCCQEIHSSSNTEDTAHFPFHKEQHHNHDEHSHEMPQNEPDSSESNENPQCCESLFSAFSNNTIAMEVEYSLSHISETKVSKPEKLQGLVISRPGRSVVFVLREYCALTSLPNGPPFY